MDSSPSLPTTNTSPSPPPTTRRTPLFTVDPPASPPLLPPPPLPLPLPPASRRGRGAKAPRRTPRAPATSLAAREDQQLARSAAHEMLVRRPSRGMVRPAESAVPPRPPCRRCRRRCRRQGRCQGRWCTNPSRTLRTGTRTVRAWQSATPYSITRYLGSSAAIRSPEQNCTASSWLLK